MLAYAEYAYAVNKDGSFFSVRTGSMCAYAATNVQLFHVAKLSFIGAGPALNRMI